MKILFLSPHLDDAVFSCGATLVRLLENGHEVTVLTIFTGNVEKPTGFALECQTSKGIAPDVDYMALRRDEDRAALELLGVPNILHFDFLEAPHRGYNSPPQLFAGVRKGDDIGVQIAKKLDFAADFGLVFCPQGLGNHVDHLHTIEAALYKVAPEKLVFYRDTPYAIREPLAGISLLLPDDLESRAVCFGEPVLERKIAACCAYSSQIGFQFGGPDGVREKLRAFHQDEAEWGETSPLAERFLTAMEAPIFP